MNLGINDLWPTKLLYTKFKNQEIHEKLVDNIFENLDTYLYNSKERQDTSIFNLKFDILKKFKETEVLPLLYEYLDHIDVGVKDYVVKVKGWLANTNDPYLAYHNHKGASISAVFYPFFENKDGGGEVVFHDPRTNANRGYINDFSKLFEPVSFSPSSGDVIIFPSFLYHHVNPYHFSPRIAIAVDYFFIDL